MLPTLFWVTVLLLQSSLVVCVAWWWWRHRALPHPWVAILLCGSVLWVYTAHVACTREAEWLVWVELDCDAASALAGSVLTAFQLVWPCVNCLLPLHGLQLWPLLYLCEVTWWWVLFPASALLSLLSLVPQLQSAVQYTSALVLGTSVSFLVSAACFSLAFPTRGWQDVAPRAASPAQLALWGTLTALCAVGLGVLQRRSPEALQYQNVPTQ